MSRSREPSPLQRGEAQAVSPDLALVKVDMDAEKDDMSQHGQEQAPLPDLSALKHEYEIDIEEHNPLLQIYHINCVKVERPSQPGSSARLELSVVKVEPGAQELGSVQGAEPQSVSQELLVKTEPFELKEECETAQEPSSHSVRVGGIKIKIEEDCILDQSWKLFRSTVVLRDCAAELQQSGRYCQQCRVQFSSCSALADHNSAASMLLTEALNNTNKIKCNLCEFSATKYCSLKRHMLRHTEKKIFKCDHCQSSCASRSNLIAHMRIHTGEKPFKCDQCQFSTAVRCNLIAHMRIHTGEKPYKCNQCQFSAARHSSLVIHKRTHTGEKPFKCDQCQYSCNSTSKLGVHMKAHRITNHTNKCDQCQLSCTSRSKLIVHMRIHTGEKPFKCDQCQFSTARNGTLIAHKRTHTGEKPFKCDLCQFSTTRNYTLVIHKRTHTGEKPFKSDLYQYSSTRSSAVALHKRIHKKPYRSNEYVNNSNDVLISECARADEEPDLYPERPPATKTYSRLARK